MAGRNLYLASRSFRMLYPIISSRVGTHANWQWSFATGSSSHWHQLLISNKFMETRRFMATSKLVDCMYTHITVQIGYFSTYLG